MSIVNDLIELDCDKSDIQDALVAKGVTSAGKHGFNKFAKDIASITNQYTSSDEGKVVSNGSLVAQTSTTATSNGTIDTTTNNEVVVNVANSYTASDEGKVVSGGVLVNQTNYGTVTENGTYDTTTNNSVTVSVPMTTKSITSNGTYNASSDSVKGYTQVSVAVPNTYAAGDEGKVVSSGALVAQTAYATITDNGTYDTTTNNSVVVDVGSDYDVTSVTADDTRYGVPQLFMQNTQNYTILYGIMYPSKSETIITIPNDFNMKFTTYNCSAANCLGRNGSYVSVQVNSDHTIRIYDINAGIVGYGTNKPAVLIVLWK